MSLPSEYPLDRTGRRLMLAWGLCLLCGFALAGRLQPDARGYGTHEQLGLPPCTLRWLFGIPCPGCGMTTCFAHIVRGHWQAAWAANCAGVPLACVCAVAIPWCWISAARGSTWLVSQPDRAACWLIVGLTFVAGAQWIWRLANG